MNNATTSPLNAPIYASTPLTEAAIARRRQYTLIAFIAIVVGVAALVSFDRLFPWTSGFALSTRIAAALLGWSIAGLVCGNYCAGAEWLPDYRCAELAQLCDDNPGLIPYRDQVRALRRPFLVREMAEMQAWVRRARRSDDEAHRSQELARERARAGSQRLYGIAHEVPLGPLGRSETDGR